MVVLAPTRSSAGAAAPRAPAMPKSRSMPAAPSSTARACGSRPRPVSLSTSRVPTRSNSRASSTASSSLRAALVADCDSAMRPAAPVVLPASATAVKTASWRKVIRMPAVYLPIR